MATTYTLECGHTRTVDYPTVRQLRCTDGCGQRWVTERRQATTKETLGWLDIKVELATITAA